MALKTIHFVQGLSRTPLLFIPRYLTNIFSKYFPKRKQLENRKSENLKFQKPRFTSRSPVIGSKNWKNCAETERTGFQRTGRFLLFRCIGIGRSRLFRSIGIGRSRLPIGRSRLPIGRSHLMGTVLNSARSTRSTAHQTTKGCELAAIVGRHAIVGQEKGGTKAGIGPKGVQ
jgi:hypothetical protein